MRFGASTTNQGALITEGEFEDYPTTSWEDYEEWEQFMDILCGWWPPVDPPDWYWDSISWPDKYVTHLDARRYWCKGRPKHLRFKDYEAYKHWRGESRRRQSVKTAKKHSFRIATRMALLGQNKKLRKFWPASTWDID